jgi:hypothetical protein
MGNLEARTPCVSHLTPVHRDEPCFKKFELKSNLDPISKLWRKGNFTINRELKMRGRWWFGANFFFPFDKCF